MPTFEVAVLLRIDNLKQTFANCLLFQVPCDNSSAVPIMHWHGTLDPLFPWLVPVQYDDDTADDEDNRIIKPC